MSEKLSRRLLPGITGHLKERKKGGMTDALDMMNRVAASSDRSVWELGWARTHKRTTLRVSASVPQSRQLRLKPPVSYRLETGRCRLCLVGARTTGLHLFL